jgi:hypothetical protein
MFIGSFLVELKQDIIEIFEWDIPLLNKSGEKEGKS